MAMGESRRCGCLAESLTLDEKDEVYRAGVDLEALFSELSGAGWSQERYGSLGPGADAPNNRRAVNKGG